MSINNPDDGFDIGQGLHPAQGPGQVTAGQATPPPDPSQYAKTGFYTDSPGPGFDNYGQPIPGYQAGPAASSWTYGNDQQAALLAGLNAGQSGQSWLDSYNTNFGLQPGGSLAYYGDSNTYALPGGYAALGANGQWGWNPRSAGGSGGAGGGAVSPPPSIGASPFAAGDQQRQAQADQLFTYLMGRAQQSENVTADDPIIKGQVDSYASQQVDQSRNMLSALAEKGGANYNADAQQRSIAENLGKNTADFQSGLMSRELQARRDEVAQSLTQASGLLSAEQSMALQDELARLDAAMNESQFGRSLAERGFEFGATNNP